MLLHENEVLVRSYQRKPKNYGKLRFFPYENSTIAYRLVRVQTKNHSYRYWLICGKSQSCGPQLQVLKQCCKVTLEPIRTSEERTKLRIVMATVAKGNFVFKGTENTH